MAVLAAVAAFGTAAVAGPPAGHVFVAAAGTNRVIEFTPSGEKVQELGASDGLVTPWDVEFGAKGRLYVSSNGSDEIFVYDEELAFEFKWSVPLGSSAPRGLAIGPRGEVYVSVAPHRIVVFDAEGMHQRSLECPTGLGDPGDLAFDPAGRLWYCSREGSALVQLGISGGALKVIALPGVPESVVFGANYHCAVSFPGLDEVRIYDSESGSDVGSLLTCPSPSGLARAANGDLLASSTSFDSVVRTTTIAAIDWTDPSLDSPRGLAMCPYRMKIKLAGTRTLALASDSSQVKKSVKVAATLSIYNGRDQCILDLDPPDAEIEAALGADVLVFNPLQISKSIPAGREIQYSAIAREPFDHAILAGSLRMSYRLKRSKHDPFLDDVIQNLRGRIQMSAQFAIVDLKITKVGALNSWK